MGDVHFGRREEQLSGLLRREAAVTNTLLKFEAGEFVARIAFRDDKRIAGLFILKPEAV